jgi:hypothetical protein
MHDEYIIIIDICLINYQCDVFTYTRGGGRDWVMWRAFTGVLHCVFDQILNLQNCFTTFTGQFLRKADI